MNKQKQKEMQALLKIERVRGHHPFDEGIGLLPK